MSINRYRLTRLGAVIVVAGLAIVASFALRTEAGSNAGSKLPTYSDHIAESKYLAQRFGSHPATELIAAESHAQAMPHASLLPGVTARTVSNTSAPAISGLPGGRWTAIGPNSIDTNSGNPYWIGQTGPNSGRALAVVTDPTTSGATKVIYIGTQAGGVWKSVNNGVSWVPLTDNMPILTIDALVMDPTNHLVLYAATGENDHSLDSGYGIGVYKTADGGNTWTILGGTNPATNPFISGAGITYKFNALVIDPNNHNILFGGTNHGLWKYNNTTSAWSQVTAATLPSTGLQISDIAIDSSTNPTTLYVADTAPFGGSASSGIYKSVDYGANWTDLTTAMLSSLGSYSAGGVTWTDRTNIARTTLATAPSSQKVLYVAPSDPDYDLYGTDPNNPLVGVVFKSVNSGATWSLLQNVPDVPDGAHAPGNGQAWYDLYLRVDPLNANIAYLGGVNIARTADGGATWKDITHVYDAYPSPVHPDQHNITFMPPASGTASPFIAVNDGGVYGSNDGGTTWLNLNNNLDTLESYVTTAGLNFANQPLAWSGMQDNGSNKYTGNLLWANLFGGDGGFTAIDPTNQKTVYEEYVYLSIYKSTDGGFNWNGGTNGITSPPVVNRGPITSAANALFIAPFVMDPNAIYSNATPGYTPPAGGPTPAHAWNQHLLAGSDHLYETLDGAATWCPLNATAFDASISAIAIAPANSQPNQEVFYVGLQNGKVWQTTNGYVTANAATTPGTTHCVATSTWTEIDNGQITAPTGFLPYISSISVDPVDSSLVYVTTSYGGNNYLVFNGPHTFETRGGGVYTWTAMDGTGTTSLPNLNANAVLSYKSNLGTVVIVGLDTGIYYTLNPAGNPNPSWSLLGSLPNSPVNYLATDASQTTLLAATKGRGTFVMPIPQLTPSLMGSGDTIGVFNQSTAFIAGFFELSNTLTTGAVNIDAPMGSDTDYGIVGDWTGQGTATIGVFRPATTQFILKDSNAPLSPATHVFTYGRPDGIPVVGDWTGSGHKSIGIYVPSQGAFYLRNSLTTGYADETEVFGPANGIPVAGHWDGSAVDHIGVYKNGMFYLSTTSCAVGTQCSGTLYKAVAFGISTDLPVVGDWTHSGSTELGVYRLSSGMFFLCTSPTQVCGYANISTAWTGDSGLPLAGHWNNSGNPDVAPHAPGAPPTVLVPKTPVPSVPNNGSIDNGGTIGD